LKDLFDYNNDSEMVEDEYEQIEEDLNEETNGKDDLIKIIAQKVSENLL